MKPGVKRDRSEYVQILHQQLRWIERSASAYDDGDVDEAIRIATHVRTLVYDKGGSSISLLAHLGIKKTVRFLSTATPKSPTSEMWAGITYMEIGAQFAYATHLPKLGKADVNRLVPFEQWWLDDVIYMFPKPPPDSPIKVARKDLVLWAANKDGGAHVDEIVPETYRWLEDGAGWSITVNPDNGPSRTMSFENAHLSALRQIAYEILNTQDLCSVK